MLFRSYVFDLIRGHSRRLSDLFQRQETGDGELPNTIRPPFCLAQRPPLFKPFFASLLKSLFVAFGETLIAGILEESPPIPLRYLFLKLVPPHKMWIVQPPERVLQAG